jgi:DUF4097 and DUF4098 domain-containing protein YvlB
MGCLGRNFQRRVPASANGEVTIANVAGSIEVHGWERNEVEVRARIGRDVERIDVISEAGRTRIQVVLPRRVRHDGHADLDVRVPRGSRLDVSAVSADIISEDVLGAQRLKTVSGEINGNFAGAELEAESVSGDVSLRGNGKAAGSRLSTVSGNIDLEDTAGTAELISVSGDIRIELGDTRQVRGRTTSGNLDLRAKLLRDARVDIETVSGELTLRTPTAAGFVTEFESFSGDIEGCHAAAVTRASKYGPGMRLNVTHGAGGARIRVKSLSGDIDFCDR